MTIQHLWSESQLIEWKMPACNSSPVTSLHSLKMDHDFLGGTPKLRDTYLFLLLVKVVNDDTNKKIESEESPKDNEDDKIEIHVEIHFIGRLFLHLRGQREGYSLLHPGPPHAGQAPTRRLQDMSDDLACNLHHGNRQLHT